MTLLFSAVAVRLPTRQAGPLGVVPVTSAWVFAEIWLKPIDPPMPTAPAVIAMPPPIAVMMAASVASKATAAAVVTVALSMVASVVSTIRLIETEPAKSLPFAVVSPASAAVTTPRVPDRVAATFSAGWSARRRRVRNAE